MQNKYDIEFQPGQRQRKDQITRFVLGFGAILLLLVVASVFVWQREGLLDNWFSNTEVTQPDANEDPDAWTHTGDTAFLICGHDNARQNLHFVLVLEVDVAQRQFLITPLDPQALAYYRGREITLEEAFVQGGVRGLQNAAEALTTMQIDRYIAASESEFIRYINTMGRVSVQLEQGIDFAGDFRLRMVQGDNPLQGDMLMRYFRYLGIHGNFAQQGVLFAQVLATYLVPRNATTPAVLEARFRSLGDILNTDITVADFFAQRDMLMDLMAEHEQIVIETR